MREREGEREGVGRIVVAIKTTIINLQRIYSIVSAGYETSFETILGL